MLFRLFLLFVALPLLELAILVRLGTWIGYWPTIGIVLVTGFAGAALARHQGLRVWTAMRRELEQGRMPVGDLVDGLMILIGGVVLLTPGLITDLFGLALLIPWTRNGLKRSVRRRLERMASTGRVSITMLLR